VLREFHWKHWSHAKPFFNRARVLEEVVDVMHFLANMLVAIGVSDDELEATYQAKQETNRQRQRDRYEAAQGKEPR
jgi:dimeric dUTPase (all-alpha-NTP-PPase superfamily)